MSRRLSITFAAMLALSSTLAWAGPPPKHDISEIGPTKGVIVAPSNEVEHKKGEQESAEEEDEAAPPGEINWVDFGNKKQPPLLALLINFGLLVYIYYRFGKDPIAQGLKDRRDAIAKDIENAAMILDEAKTRAESYQSKLEQKDDDAEAARTGLVQAGEGEKERIIKDADEKAVRLKKDALFIAEQELKQMQIDLVKETVERAISDAEMMLQKGVTQADQERLAEEYLSTLVSEKAAGVV
jgi:F0F1-type ATP synthase membrane subunit b/b'